NKISIYCKKNQDSIKCKEAKVSNNNLEIYFNENDLRSYKGKCCVRFKRRVHRYLNSFYEIIDIPLENNRVIIESKYFDGKNILQGDVCEAYLVVFKDSNQEYEIPIISEDIITNYFKIRKFLKCKIFTTPKNKLALFFIQNESFRVKSVELIDNDEFVITLNNQSNIDISSLKLITYSKKVYLKNGYKIEAFKYLKEINKIVLNASELYNLVKAWNGQGFILNAIVNYFNDDLKKNVLEEVNIQLDNEINIKEINNNNYKINLSLGDGYECIFKLKSNRNIKKKIAILGSCHSRVAFSSSDYYNPGYKEKYEVVFTQFHSSLISVMGDRKRIFDEHYFSELKQVNKEYLKLDFEKRFFEEVNNSNIDYLIIDLFADVQRGIIVFPDESIITASVYVENSEIMFNLEEDSKVILPSNINEYLPLWIDAAERFAKEIVKYIDESKIVINYIKFTESYIDKNNNKKIYDTQLDFIRLSNLLADWMNDYLVKLLPRAKIIDSRKLNYIGFENNPLGNSSNHYESGYYKEFMELIDNIILKNR
ncbi:DUF6270 domain-containing protein, partial [uncultured Clostridium sp.]|uniref:DUF6270 domain-containing protein n=1 Tax=uncultured Clostridium sp. TaxID=59620 RepID=UPI0025983AAF